MPKAVPETLAAFRIAVGFALLFSTELHAGPRFAALPAALRVAPEGIGWFLAVVPITPKIAEIARGLAIFGAAATMLGVYTRVTSLVLFVAAFYLLAVGQLAGTVVHDMHLVWFSAIVAASPSADVASVDAWWARREGAPIPLASPERYGIPVWTARLLFACIYFFPGLFKVATQGLGWVSPENLDRQLYWKWFEWGHVPSFRLDQHPILLVAGGIGVLAFELGFPFLLVSNRTRAVAAVLGLGFHLATQRFFRIPFSSIWLCYPVLVDWPRARDGAAHHPRSRSFGAIAEIVVCSALLAGALIQGARGKMDAFPFACYPTFQYRPPREAPDLRIVGISADGSRFDIPHARDTNGVRSQASWGRIWTLAGATHPTDDARLLAYAAEVEQKDPKSFAVATRIEMRRAYSSIEPEARGEPPLREDLLASFTREQIATEARK